MATATQQKQDSKAPQKEAQTAPSAATPDLDLNALFSDLTVEASSEPLPEITRGGSTGPNPFVQPLKDSVEQSTPYSFYIPAPAVKRAVFLINSAARKENVGVRVVVNVQRDASGKIVKDATGQASYIVEGDGPNKGKVLVRFQGKKERKQQSAPRPYSITKDKSDASGNTYKVTRRSDKVVVFTGTHEAAKTEYDRLKALPETPQATDQTTAATSPAAPTAPSAEAAATSAA